MPKSIPADPLPYAGTSCRRSNLLGQHYIRPEWVAYLCGADLRTPNRGVRYRVSLLSTTTTRQRRSEIGEAVAGSDGLTVPNDSVKDRSFDLDYEIRKLNILPLQGE